jgi:hypothetical protein
MKKKKLPIGRPPRIDKDNKAVPSGERGTLPGEKRKTYIVNTELANKIDAIAYWDRTSVKEVVKDAFIDKIKKYEKKNGAIKLP